MDKTIQINVTQEDINNGKPHCASNCPVAIAVHRAFENQGIWLNLILVNNYSILIRAGINAGPPNCIIGIPKKVYDFIRAFDSKGSPNINSPITPFSFELTYDNDMLK